LTEIDFVLHLSKENRPQENNRYLEKS